MAFMDQANKKRLGALAKGALAKWPGIKWTLAVQNHSTIVLTITESNLDFAAALAPAGNHHESFRARLAEREHLDVNHHSVERDFQGDARAFLLAARDALMTGNHNNSDPQSDFYDVGWYVKIQIGRWNKPCRFTFERAPESAERETASDDESAAAPTAYHVWIASGPDAASAVVPGRDLADAIGRAAAMWEAPASELSGHAETECTSDCGAHAQSADELVARANDVSREMFGDEPELPNDDVLAAMLSILVNPESDQEQRDAVAERLDRVGRSIETSTFREAGVLTDDAGFIVRFGGLAEYQITVVRSR